MFRQKVQEQPDQVYLRQPVDGGYKELTWAEAYDQTLRFAEGLKSLGLQPGDRVALLSSNCAEWFISDFACLAAGLIPTPIYATAGQSIISYVLEHSEAKAIIIGDVPKADVVDSSIPGAVIKIGMTGCQAKHEHTLSKLVEDNSPIEKVHEPSMDETFSIVYTSGSTGAPKGVVLTYGNISYAAAISVELFSEGADPNQRFLSYLPLAHVTERALVEYNSLYCGATVTFNESLETFIRDLRSAEVTSFISVPRLWVKFQSQVLAAIPQKKLDLMLKLPIVSGVIKRKIKDQLGLGKVKSVGSGSAPISPHILEWYGKLGIDISEGWGMSETTGMATTLFPFRADKLGTIGKVIDGFEIRISEQGEILIKGEGVFKEYYKNPEVTAEAFTEDGFLRTGDKADVDNEGYLQITGRVKDIFKTGKGKYVAPVPIEAKLANNLLIEQLCVMGSGLPASMAVVVLSEEIAEGMSREEIEASLTATMQSVNAEIEKHEVLGGIRIAKDPWTIENGLLTPTLKVKRTELEDKYLSLISQPSKDVVAWE